MLAAPTSSKAASSFILVVASRADARCCSILSGLHQGSEVRFGKPTNAPGRTTAPLAICSNPFGQPKLPAISSERRAVGLIVATKGRFTLPWTGKPVLPGSRPLLRPFTLSQA